ncbi:hypothetical protein PO124_14105 [Bacillus licheniformis]|nr:hypothetical protein [Bacillus licheniformis]
MNGRSYTEFCRMVQRSRLRFNILTGKHRNNVFHVVEEFEVERMDGRGTVRPDIVLLLMVFRLLSLNVSEHQFP